MVNKKHTINYKPNILALLLLAACPLLFVNCTFDYGERAAGADEIPDIVMYGVYYVRVRGADPLARFQAERAERFENQGVMRIQSFSFEQFGGEGGEEVNALGNAGFASVDINTIDVFMSSGVRIEIDTEDIIIETYQLEWRDQPRTLSTPVYEEVYITQDIGTSFTGIGLQVDARRRSWEFAGPVSGTYYFEEDEEEAEADEIDEAYLDTGENWW